MVRSAASLVLQASERDDDGAFFGKIEKLTLLCMHATASAHLGDLFTVTDST